MMRGLTYFVVLCTIFLLGSGIAFAAEKVSLQLDGEVVETDVPPIIENDRTLVPYRALLESMGAEVSWEQEAHMATAVLGRQRVQVTIDNTTGFVNGKTKSMDVPPRLIDSRTLIPLRFVLENLNCTVDWDPVTRTVLVSSPPVTTAAAITSIAPETTDSSYRITAYSSDEITVVNSFAYEKPYRFGIDIKNAVLPEGVGSFTADNEIFYQVRYSQLDEETVRIVVDLNQKVAGKISLSEDRKSLYLDFDIPEHIQEDLNRGGEGKNQPEPAPDTENILPELDWRMTGKLVAIDVGHGGRDPGAEGVKNGRNIIWEKDLNLAIALRLHELLTQAGANVVMLRDSDVHMSLYSRPEAANSLNADLLVSIHNNSSETAKPKGTEVLYYSKDTEPEYGIYSKDIARLVQEELVAGLGLFDRGIKSSPQLAVLNKSLMPSIIIEGGFLSNPEDLEFMITEEYKEAYAVSAAIGIIRGLNDSVENMGDSEE